MTKVFAHLVALVLLLLAPVSSFAPQTTKPLSGHRSGKATALRKDSCPSLKMGIFDALSKAFENTDYGPPAEAVRASARHILVPSAGEAQVVMKMIANGEQSFEECAQTFSTCPSSSKGGSLGSFSPGTMVPEFDKVVFNPETQIGEVVGPVETDFGYHVIVVDKRSGGGDWY